MQSRWKVQEHSSKSAFNPWIKFEAHVKSLKPDPVKVQYAIEWLVTPFGHLSICAHFIETYI